MCGCLECGPVMVTCPEIWLADSLECVSEKNLKRIIQTDPEDRYLFVPHLNLFYDVE